VKGGRIAGHMKGMFRTAQLASLSLRSNA